METALRAITAARGNNNNPKKYFNHSIHIPGLGRNLTMLGNNDINKYNNDYVYTGTMHSITKTK